MVAELSSIWLKEEPTQKEVGEIAVPERRGAGLSELFREGCKSEVVIVNQNEFNENPASLLKQKILWTL